MDEIQIKLAGIWVALMLVYLLGDVLRIFSGDFVAGEIEGKPVTQAMWLGISMLMLTPIIMILLTLLVDHSAIRWVNIIVAVLWFGFNLIGLPTYPGAYDKFLLVVSLGINVLTIWYAWNWVPA